MLDKARKALLDHKLAIVYGETTQTFNERGIKMLLSIVSDTPNLLCGATVADKIVGKAAALLMVHGNVKEVYAEVISESAIDVFRRYGIPFTYGTITSRIVNRLGTGICPMEETVLGISEPEKAFEALKVALKQTQILLMKRSLE